MELLTPLWQDYELIDSGNGEKLERFGEYTLRRPEPQAVWSPFLSEKEWLAMPHATFKQDGSHGGQWVRHRPMSDQWYIQYSYKQMNLRMRLGMTAFKHVGVFPEQAANWTYIYDACTRLRSEMGGENAPKVLNIFAYTGGASLAARAGGADVIHCDSIKQVVNWAAANMEASHLRDIRWLVEDAFKFVQREAKRGNQYQGIILDPPAYGHGPKGERWQLEEMINELMEAVGAILAPEKRFMVFNSYSLGFSSMVLQNLAQTHLGASILPDSQLGELYAAERSGRRLPMGVFFRFAQ